RGKPVGGRSAKQAQKESAEAERQIAAARAAQERELLERGGEAAQPGLQPPPPAPQPPGPQAPGLQPQAPPMLPPVPSPMPPGPPAPAGYDPAEAEQRVQAKVGEIKQEEERIRLEADRRMQEAQRMQAESEARPAQGPPGQTTQSMGAMPPGQP